MRKMFFFIRFLQQNYNIVEMPDIKVDIYMYKYQNNNNMLQLCMLNSVVKAQVKYTLAHLFYTFIQNLCRLENADRN